MTSSTCKRCAESIMTDLAELAAVPEGRTRGGARSRQGASIDRPSSQIFISAKFYFFDLSRGR